MHLLREVAAEINEPVSRGGDGEITDEERQEFAFVATNIKSIFRKIQQ